MGIGELPVLYAYVPAKGLPPNPLKVDNGKPKTLKVIGDKHYLDHWNVDRETAWQNSRIRYSRTTQLKLYRVGPGAIACWGQQSWAANATTPDIEWHSLGQMAESWRKQIVLCLSTGKLGVSAAESQPQPAPAASRRGAWVQSAPEGWQVTVRGCDPAELLRLWTLLAEEGLVPGLEPMVGAGE